MLVRPGFEPTASRAQQTGAYPIELTGRRFQAIIVMALFTPRENLSCLHPAPDQCQEHVHRVCDPFHDC